MFPGRKLTAKALVYCISNFGNVEPVNDSSKPNQPTEGKSTSGSNQSSEGQITTSGSEQSAAERETSGLDQPNEEKSTSKPCQPGKDELTRISESLSYPLTDHEKQHIWYTLSEFDLPLDSMLILKTLVLRISVDNIPTEIHGEWGIYVHNFNKGKRPQYYEANSLYDPYRSVIHVSRDWMDSVGGRIEVAVLGADTSDPKMLHLETIVLDRSGKLCYRVGATDLRFKVAEGDSIEETLTHIIEENPIEIIILG
jgi:hypothetical protein